MPRSASVVHGIVIEARLVRRKPETTGAAVQHGRGVLLGQIEVQERVRKIDHGLKVDCVLMSLITTRWTEKCYQGIKSKATLKP